VPATLEAGLDVCLIGRPGDESPCEYGHAGTGPTGRLRWLRVEWFEGPAEMEDLPAELTERLRSSEPLLVTCTLRKEIANRQAFVEELLRSRPKDAETIFLACENAPDDVYEEIARNCAGAGVRVLRTVVNRMCVGLERDSGRRRMVSAHQLGEWLIERRGEIGPLLTTLATSYSDGVEMVGDIEARYDRKLWMVNGAHQALALIAREGFSKSLPIPSSGQGLLPGDDLREAARNVRALTRLSHLHGAMDDALQRKHPALEDNLSYGVKHVEAYCEHPDSISRVLGAFCRRDLAPFIQTLEVRLAHPARICFNLGRSVRPFEFVFDIFESLVEDLNLFSDAKSIRLDPASITLEADKRALESYSRLVRGWNSKRDAEKRVLRFAEALAASRPDEIPGAR
jgi:hypothetical protein